MTGSVAVPYRQKGGSNSITNLTLSCEKCN
ncbi:MAG: HNH endonuclease, partial [Nostoc sp. NMS1]|nr:HNH endonuclease [Nostoc sp. NMS1]MBN3990933.1 HNH endonuclease [Nostoc sp. NMS2]